MDFFPPFFFFAPFVYVVPFPNLLLFSDCFPEFSVFSVTKMKSDIVYARAQAAILRSSGHSVKEIAKFVNKTVRWVNRWSKRECFENKPRSGWSSALTNSCSKINRESEVQTEQFNKENCQEYSAEKYQSFEHNGVEIPGKDGRLSSKTKCLPIERKA